MTDQKSMTVDFSGLVLGFCSAALSYLGLIPEGQSPVAVNLPLAKQNIDILELLQVKSRGNLTPDEDKLLQQALADLRVKYVEAAKKG